ncbi:MAG: polysaccharide deacetylase family protein [Bacteroidota bacterium]|nr:polysaccharide deacetylase family protein [Bacteroidota bacterium]
MDKIDLIHASKLYKVFKPFYSGIGHVLVFHRVGEDDSLVFTKDLQVSPESLERFLQYFNSNNIDIVTLDECYKRILSGKREKRFVAFTFDDGFRDNLSHALPVFEKYNAPFALFLTTGFPDHKIVLWSYMLENLVLNNTAIDFTDRGQRYSYSLSSENEKREAFKEIRTYILSSSPENLIPRLKNIFHASTKDLYSLTSRMALSWEEVKELSDHPLVSIGSHTVNHLALRNLPEEKAIREISDSLTIIEDKTGRPVSHMAYPYGMPSAVGPREFNLASQTRLKLAFTTVSSNIMKHHARNLHALPRIEMRNEWTDKTLDLYVNGYLPFLHRLFN